jgi:protein O-GlcNAc transferase
MSSSPSQQTIQNLVALFQSGQLSEAEPLAKRLTQRFPAHPFGWAIWGAILRAQKRNQEALNPMKTAATLSPSDATMRFNVGNIFRDLGDYESASTWYAQALKLNPQFVQAHYQLANLQHDLGLLPQAEQSYRKALQLNPANPQALANLAHVLQDLGHHDKALDSLRRALAIEPDNAALHFNLADLLHDQGRLREACTAGERALALEPDFVPALCNMGAILADLGDSNGAMSQYRRALEVKPNDTNAQSGLLFLLNYFPSQVGDAQFQEAVRFGRMAAQQAHAAYSDWECEETPERLRVGFVSGDFRTHSVGYFLEAFLAEIDPFRVEILAFPTSAQCDALTERIRPHFSKWVPLTGLTDQHAAQLIRGLGVHILVDLSGHTTHNRLPMFALRPAPLQATWLGYFATTGVEAIDFLIADPWSLPPVEEHLFTEKIWRLPNTRLCLTAPTEAIHVNPLPAPGTGNITFGCFNNLNKINDDVVALWSRVLLSVPRSRLLLKGRQFQDPQVVEDFFDKFAVHGISREQLKFEGPSSRVAYFEAYHRVDIGLDPFPFPGGTTTAESLWMGVPVLTLSGKHFLSRQGVSLMAASGLKDWIAEDADDYVAKAVAHASNLDALAGLRQLLRGQVLASPLFDANAFARDFEAALYGMWQSRLGSGTYNRVFST